MIYERVMMRCVYGVLGCCFAPFSTNVGGEFLKSHFFGSCDRENGVIRAIIELLLVGIPMHNNIYELCEILASESYTLR